MATWDAIKTYTGEIRVVPLRRDSADEWENYLRVTGGGTSASEEEPIMSTSREDRWQAGEDEPSMIDTEVERAKAGRELDRLTTTYRVEHPGTSYENAFRVIRRRHPQLTKRYATAPIPTPADDIAAHNLAGIELEAAMAEYQARHPEADSESALKAAMRDHPALAKTYSRFTTGGVHDPDQDADDVAWGEA